MTMEIYNDKYVVVTENLESEGEKVYKEFLKFDFGQPAFFIKDREGIKIYLGEQVDDKVYAIDPENGNIITFDGESITVETRDGYITYYRNAEIKFDDHKYLPEMKKIIDALNSIVPDVKYAELYLRNNVVSGRAKTFHGGTVYVNGNVDSVQMYSLAIQQGHDVVYGAVEYWTRNNNMRPIPELTIKNVEKPEIRLMKNKVIIKDQRRTISIYLNGKVMWKEGSKIRTEFISNIQVIP